MADIKLNVKMREGVGKNKVKKMRKEFDIPAVVYGQGEEALTITAIEKELDKAYKAAGSSVIIDLVLDGKEIPVLFKDVLKHPFKNQYTHVDFFKVNMKETLKVMVPVVLEGRDSINIPMATLNQQVNEIEVECLPVDIPETATVDVTNMQVGDTITVKDLDIFKNEKLSFTLDAEEVVASLTEQKEEAPQEEAVEAGEVPTVEETEAAEEE